MSWLETQDSAQGVAVASPGTRVPDEQTLRYALRSVASDNLVLASVNNPELGEEEGDLAVLKELG